LGPPAKSKKPAARYGPDQQPLPSHIEEHPGASSVYASVSDLARFGMFQLGTLGPTPGRPPLSAEKLAEMHARVDPEDRYGLGIGSGRADGKAVLWHDGRMPGVSASLELYPEYGVVFALVGNGANLKPEFGVVRIEAMEAMGFPARADWLCEREADDPIFGAWSGSIRMADQERPMQIEIQPSGDFRV